MLRLVSIWILLLLSAVCTVFAGLLLWPADVFELLIGFGVGTLGTAQLMLFAIVALLLTAIVMLNRPVVRWRRSFLVGLGVMNIALALIVLVRDFSKFSRTTISLEAGSVQLAATMYRPRGPASGRRPTILILHGSGPIKRDAYHLFARRFAERGFIVLNADKRGVGGSGGTYAGDDLGQPVIEGRAQEARVALSYLARQADVDTAQIGVFGISQGGWVVPLLLNRDTPARFGVVFSGAAVSSREEGRWSDWAGEDSDHFGFEPPLLPFSELDKRIQGVAPGDFDPRDALRQMKSPSLWVFGEWDSSAPTSASL